MSFMKPRKPAEIEVLSREIRRDYPFAGSVRTWLREHLALIDTLKRGLWRPRQAEGQMVRPGPWQMDDIRQALVSAGVHYRASGQGQGSLTLKTLYTEVSLARREVSIAAFVRAGSVQTSSSAMVVHGSPRALELSVASNQVDPGDDQLTQEAPAKSPVATLEIGADEPASPPQVSKTDARRILGANVRDTRKRRGLSQADLADRTGLAQSDISAIKSGKANTKLHTMVKLSRALGEPLHLLLQP